MKAFRKCPVLVVREGPGGMKSIQPCGHMALVRNVHSGALVCEGHLNSKHAGKPK